MHHLDKYQDDIGPEGVHYLYDPCTKLKAIVVIDTKIAGRYGGGIRMLPDITAAEMIGLARAMTYKFAVLNIPTGGAKSGIIADPEILGSRREEIMRSFGKLLKPYLKDGLGIGVDMGTFSKDLDTIYESAGIVRKNAGLAEIIKDGLPLENHATSYGVAESAKAACKIAGLEIDKATISLEGFGKVGMGTAYYMHKLGAKIIAVSTSKGAIFNDKGLDFITLIKSRKELGDDFVNSYKEAEKIRINDLFFLNSDILIPGARPYVINEINAVDIKSKVITSIANIPITDEAYDILFENGIITVPDFLSNSGGVIFALLNKLDCSSNDVFNTIKKIIGPIVSEILTESRRVNINPKKLLEDKLKDKIIKQQNECLDLPLEEYNKILIKQLIK